MSKFANHSSILSSILSRRSVGLSGILWLAGFCLSPTANGQGFAQSPGLAGPAVAEKQPNPAKHQDVLNAPELEYIISPDDVLDLYIVDVAELSRTYRVSPSGQVILPLLPGPLNVAGLTLSQFAELASRELKTRGLVSDPHITVTVKESRAHSVTISGAVKKPQIYFVLGRTTLLDVISQAEGLAEDASSVAIISRGEIAKQALGATKLPAPDNVTVDLEQLLYAGDSSLNIDIYPGDRVTVAPAGIVYVVGAVNKPGGFALTASRKRLTVLQAVALAEDLKSTARGSRAEIIRRGPQYPGGRTEIPVNVKNVLSGHAPDLPLQTEDILFVPDSPKKRAAIRGAEAAIQVATGVAIYRAY
jgi:polysaccharide export outer membrane protein